MNPYHSCFVVEMSIAGKLTGSIYTLYSERRELAVLSMTPFPFKLKMA